MLNGTNGIVVSISPSSVLENDDPSSWLYLLDSADAQTEEDQLDALLDDDMFATTMGQRMLAVSGHDVDDGLLSLQQLLLGRPSTSTLREFRAQHPRRFALYRRRGETYMLPQLRHWDLTPSGSSSEHSTYHVLPGGYVSAVGYADAGENELVGNETDRRAAEEDIEIDEDDESQDDVDSDDSEDLILQGDDDYMDWLGVQLLNRKFGAPLWVIDAVHESPEEDDDDTQYTLWEASAFVSKDLLVYTDTQMMMMMMATTTTTIPCIHILQFGTMMTRTTVNLKPPHLEHTWDRPPMSVHERPSRCVLHSFIAPVSQ